MTGFAIVLAMIAVGSYALAAHMRVRRAEKRAAGWEQVARERQVAISSQSPVPETPCDTNQISDEKPESLFPLRVAVVGNSNSVMTSSFARVLGTNSNLEVTIRSMGGSPNVILLEFLANEDKLNYDYIIVETAVVDFLLESSYPRARAQETLEFFIRYVRATCGATIIFLIIPARAALLAPAGLHWQESLYRDVAAQFNISILDGYQLVRQLVGRPKLDRSDLAVNRAGKLVSSFRLPRKLQEPLAWRSLRDPKFPSNALGVFGILDFAHFAPGLHGLVGTLLGQFISSDSSGQRATITDVPELISDLVLKASPLGGRHITRTSSLLSRDLATLSRGDTIHYQCPAGYRVFGLLLNASNKSNTSCILHLTSPAGDCTLNLAFGWEKSNWVARVIPILDVVGDGNIEATITSGADHVEVGDLILVKTAWKDTLPVPPIEAAEARNIGVEPWADALIASAVARARATVQDIEAAGDIPDKDCSAYVADALRKTSVAFSDADRARLMLVLGLTEKLTSFLATVCDEQPEDIELEEMRAALQTVMGEDSVTPHEVFARAADLIRDGATDDADALLAKGMARFMNHSEFFRERAMIATRRKDWPTAQNRWSLVQDFFPHSVDGYVWHAFVLREMGNFDAAASLLATAAAIFPDDAKLVIEQARVENRRQDWAAAKRYWDIVLEKYPDHPAGYVGSAETYRGMDQLANADAVLDKGRSRLPQDADIAMHWGEAADRVSDWALAAERWDHVRAQFPAEKRAYRYAIRAYLRLGEAIRAEQIAREAALRFPDDTEFLMSAGGSVLDASSARGS